MFAMRLYLKDFVTLLSLVCGMISMYLAVEGNVPWAATFIWIAYVFDALDGVVARLTGKKNEMGSHLDNNVDYISTSIAPSVLIYVAYEPFIGKAGALALALVPAITGTLRHARHYANPVPVTNLWVGLPRSYSGLGIAALIGSHLFFIESFRMIGIGYIIVASFLNITTFGYQGRHHKGLRPHQIVFFVLTILTWLAGVVLIAMGYGVAYFNDGNFIWMTAYIIAGAYVAIPKEEKEEYRASMIEWKKNV